MLRHPSQSVSFSIPDRDDLGIHERHGHDAGLLFVVGRIILHSRDEDAHALVHLRGGETDAVVLAHRLDHVVDEFLDVR